MFSWITADTKQSVLVDGSVPVKMIVPDGRVWEERNYEGYGIFGGKDFYELVAELNGTTGRLTGIVLAHSDNPSIILPKIVSINYNGLLEHTPHSPPCPNQGCVINR